MEYIRRHIWTFPYKSEVEDFWISLVQFNSRTAVHSNPRKFQHAYVLFTFEKMSVTCSIHPTDFSYVFIANHWIAGVMWLEYYISWYWISLSLSQIPSYQNKNKILSCPLCLFLFFCTWSILAGNVPHLRFLLVSECSKAIWFV